MLALAVVLLLASSFNAKPAGFKNGPFLKTLNMTKANQEDDPCDETCEACQKRCDESDLGENKDPCKYVCLAFGQICTSTDFCTTYLVTESEGEITEADAKAICVTACGGESKESDDVKDCRKECKDEISDAELELICENGCVMYAGKCPYDGHSDCVDGYSKKFPKTASGQEQTTSPKDSGMKEDEWEKICNAICPKGSLWWVGLVVGLVVVIAIVVVLVVICFVKKLLCFKASS